MKSLIVFALLFLILYSCSEEEQEKTTEAFEEIPAGIVESKPCSTLYKGIMDMWMEHKHNNEIHQVLFTAEAEKKIVLTRDSEVYVTFISEGAGWANTFGWYSYKTGKTPGGPSDINKHVLFPHVSNEVLKQGDMLRVGDGPFEAGTVIGFFLISRGWEDGIVDYTKRTIYTNTGWNRNDYQQHVLFKEGECGDIVLGFEDRFLDMQDCDFDYNDIIMTIADNSEQLETTSFDLSKLVVMEPQSESTGD
jgi:hypothetical protein